jgi:NADH-quinone oxidoreductase subunit N
VAYAAAILPALVAAIFGVVILLLGGTLRNGRLAAVIGWLGLAAVAVAIASARPETSSQSLVRPVASSVTLDPLARGTAWLALLLAALCAVLAALGSRQRLAGRHAAVLLALGGALLACVANDFLLIIIGVPVAALAVCGGQFWEAETVDERVSAVQSLALNVFAAVCLVSGALLLSKLAGTTNLGEFHALPAHAAASGHLAEHSARSLPLAGEIAAVLLLAGFGIPLLAAPFQLAAAEIFETASPSSLATMSVLPRCAALVAMIRVFVEGMSHYLSTSQTALTAVALVTLLIGGALAYWQTSLRRLVALLMMVETGLLLLALAAGCAEAARPGAVRWIDFEMPGGVGAAWLLFAVDSIALLGLATILGSLERSEGRVDDLGELTHLVRGDRLVAGATTFLLLSLTGVPPLAGFWARVAVLRSVLSVSFAPENDFLPHQNTGYVLFALLMITAWLAAAAPALNVARALLVPEPSSDAASGQPTLTAGSHRRGGLRLGATIAALLLALGFVPNLGEHVAARLTFKDRNPGALAADKPIPAPVKKRHRVRGGEPD